MAEIEIIWLTADTAHYLDRVAEGVFDHAVRPDQTAAFVAEPSHMMALAVSSDDAVVGMASAVRYLHPDKLPSLWINEVGVGDDWLRQGIASQLMETMLEKAEELGCEGAWLGTETDNIPALALYRKTYEFECEEEQGVWFSWDTEPD